MKQGRKHRAAKQRKAGGKQRPVGGQGRVFARRTAAKQRRKLGTRAAGTAADVAKGIRNLIRRHAKQLDRRINSNRRGFAAADIRAAIGTAGESLQAYIAMATELGKVPEPAPVQQ